MKFVSIIFLAAAGLLWVFSLGYIFALEVCVRLRRRPKPAGLAALPEIAVVIPTLNEAALIGRKLDNLKRSDYPPERIRIFVVDRGSQDRTAEIVREAVSRDARLRLVSFPEARNKAEQVGSILARLSQDIVFFTDADAALEPSCLREMAGMFAVDPRTVLVGAVVRPETRFKEEQAHWRLLNRIWWLEGEVLSCAGFSGVCFAARRQSLLAMEGNILAEDIHLGLFISARGARTRICPTAVAAELRVPRTASEFILFRRRRGACYLNEIRLFSIHLGGTPRLALCALDAFMSDADHSLAGRDGRLLGGGPPGDGPLDPPVGRGSGSYLARRALPAGFVDRFRRERRLGSPEPFRRPLFRPDSGRPGRPENSPAGIRPEGRKAGCRTRLRSGLE